MLDCLIIGDSIAVGTQRFKQECRVIAKGGINTWQFNKNYKNNFSADTVVISLGSNDHSGIKTRKELENLRSRVSSNSKVYWIVPAIKPDIQEIVKDIANYNNDIVIPITSLQPDKVHPSWSGYKEIVGKIK